MLIAFCGIDGCGKTTQIQLLDEYLKKIGKKTYLTKQPTQWYRTDKRVRKYLEGEINTQEIIKEIALFSATDRLRHIEMEIKPKIRENNIVISDRYVYSAFAYFIIRGLEYNWLKEINKYAVKPDLVFYIDINPEIAYDRIIKRDGDTAKKEERDINFLNKVSQIFKKEIWKNETNYIIINGNQNVETIHNEIVNEVNKFIMEEK